MSSDNSNTILAIVALVSGISAGVAVILKTLKKSECCKCCKFETRTPMILAPPPTPIMYHKNINNNITTDNKNIDVNNNNTIITVEEIEV